MRRARASTVGEVNWPAVVEDPVEAALGWITDARNLGVPGFDAAVVATATPDGRPSARAVLLRGLDDRGFRFYTHRRSRKGRELAANPYASLALFWPARLRQGGPRGPSSSSTAPRRTPTSPAAIKG